MVLLKKKKDVCKGEVMGDTGTGGLCGAVKMFI